MEDYSFYFFIYFSMQLFFIELVFTAKVPKKEYFWIKLPIVIILYCLAGFGWVAVVRVISLTGIYMGFLNYVCIFLVTLLMLWVLLDVPWLQIWFIGTAGYALQHLTYSVSRILEAYFQKMTGVIIEGTWAEEVFVNIGIYVVVVLVVYMLITRKPQYQLQLTSIDKRMLAISIIVLFVCTVLSDYYAHNEEGLGFTIIIVSRTYAAVACALSLVVQFDWSRQKKLENNNVMLEQLLHQERQQHEISRENIDIINRKCHDLKHQIQALENIDNQDMRSQMIEEMNKSIMIYDSSVHSGNDTLDLILTEKTLVCQEYRIKFTCILDGKSLDFMEVSDLYSLFGNALDNAIECVLQEPEERRLMSLNISRKQGMLLIHLDNYCSRRLTFEEGLPVTTKKDKAYHGYGTRSIRYIAEKYQGFVDMRQEDQRFILEILFPEL